MNRSCPWKSSGSAAGRCACDAQVREQGKPACCLCMKGVRWVMWRTWVRGAAAVSNNLIHNRVHRPISLQPLEEALVPEPAQLPVAQLPGSCLHVPHHLNLQADVTVSQCSTSPRLQILC